MNDPAHSTDSAKRAAAKRGGDEPCDQPLDTRGSDLEEVVDLIDRVRSNAPDVLSDIFLGEPGVRLRADGADTLGVRSDFTPASDSTDTTDSKEEVGDLQPVEIAHFDLQQHVGSGGSGVVFRALDTRLNRIVALKVPHAEALVTKRLRDRFLREASAAAALDHRNIVPVYEAGTTNHVAYIAYAFAKEERLNNGWRRPSHRFLDA